MQTVQSVERAYAVLVTLADASTPLTVARTAERTGLDRTVTHRLLKTLAYIGLADEREGAFALGHQNLNLGYAYLARLPVRGPALYYAINLTLQELQDYPLVISITVPVGSELAIIDQIWTPKAPLDAILDIGVKLQFDGSATGRAFLAFYDRTVAEDLVGAERLAELDPLLTAIRETGIAFSTRVGEIRPGISAIASPVRNGAGKPVAGINVSGELDTLRHRDRDKLAEQLKRTAEMIGRGLYA